jgi:hypothetical protein
MSRYQVSLRGYLIGTLLLGVLVSGLGIYWRNERRLNEVSRLADPIIQRFDSLVHVHRGWVICLNAAQSSSYMDFLSIPELQRLTHFETGWLGSNQGASFNDAALGKIVVEHPRITLLDLRSTDVSSAGLEHLAGLEELRWLLIDPSLCDSVGRSHLAKVTRLECLMIGSPKGPSPTSGELLQLRSTLPRCLVRGANEQETQTSVNSEL